MKPQSHLVASLPLAGLLWLTTGPAQALAAAAVNVLVDLDHLPDYLWWRKGRFSPTDFLRSHLERKVPTLLIPLHGWEVLAAVWLLAWWGWGPVWAASLCGAWLYHLVFDQLGNRVGPFFYFISFRASRRFSRARLDSHARLETQ